MPRRETCGNNYDKTFDIVLAGQNHTFDTFECAIHKLPPSCAHCNCRILGHGVEAGGAIYCFAHCAEGSGVHEIRDRA
jgi:hypothetical protein